jgi:hypothetical protein
MTQLSPERTAAVVGKLADRIATLRRACGAGIEAGQPPA